MKSLLELKVAILGVTVIAVAVVTKIKETVVSFLQNLLPSQTCKEGGRCSQKVSRIGAIF